MKTPTQQPGITVERLSNGVTLVNVLMRDSNSSAVVLMVNAGSRDETTQTAGLAHFLEHMFFRGTKKRPTSKELSWEIEELGGECNAFTEVEEVAYYITGPARHTRAFFEILCDIICNSSLSPREFVKEKNIVIQELASELMSPEGWISEHLPRVIFGRNQSVSWTAGGIPSVVKQVSREQLVQYRADLYAPEQMVLIVAGNQAVSPLEAEELLKHMPQGTTKKRNQAVWNPGERSIVNIRPVQGDEEEQTVMCFALPGVAHAHPDAGAYELLNATLGGGMSSRLFLNVRDEKGLCYYVNSSHQTMDDTGIFSIETATTPEDAPKAAYAVFHEIRKLASTPISDRELNKVLASIEGELFRGTDEPLRRAMFHASQWRRKNPIISPEARMSQLRQVTAADIQRVAQELVRHIPETKLAMSGPRDQTKEILEAVDGHKPRSIPQRSVQVEELQ